jgi:hypothetical protein
MPCGVWLVNTASQQRKAHSFQFLAQQIYWPACVKISVKLSEKFLTLGNVWLKQCWFTSCVFFSLGVWWWNGRDGFQPRTTLDLAQGKVTNVLPRDYGPVSITHGHFFRVSKDKNKGFLLLAFSFPLRLICLSPCPYVAICMVISGIRICSYLTDIRICQIPWMICVK